MPQRGYVIRKFWQALLTIAVVLVINYVLFRILPGDPVRLIIRNPRIDQETLEQVRAFFGLDLPWHAQFWRYVVQTLRGDLGISFDHRKPVLDVIMSKLGPTILLTGTATLLSIVLGVLLGVYAAWRRGSDLDVLALGGSLILWSMPSFWFAIIMLLIFAGYYGWFPFFGMRTPGATYTSIWDEWLDILRHLALPAVTFALLLLGQYVIIMRNSLLEVLSEDFVLTARAKGLPERDILWRHAVPNALLPMVTLIALNLGFVVGGAIQIETVFSWPGIGRMVWEALQHRDYPLLQGAFLFLTVNVIAANFLADVVYALIDPRVKA